MIAIRPAVPEDAAAIAAIYAPYVLTGTATFETDPPDADTIHARLCAGEGLYPWLVAVDDGVIGYAYAARFHARAAYRHTVETTVYLAPDCQRTGLGKLLYGTLIDLLRAQGFTQAIGAIALPNDASVRLHEVLGFRRVGLYRAIGYKLGRWIDVGHWQCTLNDRDGPPVEPRRFADRASTPDAPVGDVNAT